MTSTVYMCQEKKEEEDLPALKTALMHRYNDSKSKKKRLITISYIIFTNPSARAGYDTRFNSLNSEFSFS